MGKMEIFAIVLLCLTPILALIMALPKKKKGSKPAQSKKQEKPKKQEPAKEEQPPAPAKEVEPEQVMKPDEEQEFEKPILDDSFSSFAKRRGASHPAPTAKPYMPTRPYDEKLDNIFAPKKPVQKQEKTLGDQLSELSPEMKALILSGVLDKRKFDDDE